MKPAFRFVYADPCNTVLKGETSTGIKPELKELTMHIVVRGFLNSEEPSASTGGETRKD